MSDTQHTSVVPLGLDSGRATGTSQWLLRTDDDKNTPVFHYNKLDFFICGEKSFAQIALDLKAAKASIDIICWGFDPAMELTRRDTTWPRGDTWGDLLRDVAAGIYNKGKPVQVRLLSWYGFIGNSGTNNMPGAGRPADFERQADAAQRASRGLLPAQPGPSSPQDRREVFNAHWYREAFAGKLRNVAIRTRDGDGEAVSASLAKESGKRGFLEEMGLKLVPTDHQKTVLIDYEHEGGAHAVGYVMGLNSVTDYWDTEAHRFNDPLRGEAFEGGANDGSPGLKPYQDYACRIRGVALVAVSKNFTDAWNRAKPKGLGGGAALLRRHDLNAPPIALGLHLKNPYQRVQIVRTLPEEGDKSIKRAYWQASSFARNYLYIENQYFQYTAWAEHLKSQRQAYCRLWAKACKTAEKPPELHAFIVLPTPERSQMVPRTHDTLKSLGQGSSMPNQNKKIDDEIDVYNKQKAVFDKNPLLFPNPPTLGELAADSSAIGSAAGVKGALDTMGLRTLVASLWTYDRDWRTSQRQQVQRASEWEGMPTQKDRLKALSESLYAARYREIYIHSKLMLIDDSFLTMGSANLNERSMVVDAEINISTDNAPAATDLRSRVWGMHTGDAPDCNPASWDAKGIADAFVAWEKLIKANAEAKVAGDKPTGFLQPFEDKRTSNIRLS